MIKSNKLLIIGTILLSAFTLSGCSSSQVQYVAAHEAKYAVKANIRHHAYRAIDKAEEKLKNKFYNKNKQGKGVATSENKEANYQTLANSNFKSGTSAVIKVNNDKATLNPADWKTNKIVYGNLDNQNRTTTDIAYLSKQNLGKSKGRDPQTWIPTGWHNEPKRVNGKRVFPMNRGHLLAYTLTFNFDINGKYKQGAEGSLNNPKNLASQTAYSNQKPMQEDSEDLVRNALEANKKVIYKVTTVFRGNEKMPRGYWVQAISTDGTLNFNRYIYNVQPGLMFDYSTGRSTVDMSMKVAE